MKNYALDRNLFQNQTLVILALSGGVDSVYLLHFLIWLKERRIYENFALAAAHLNHALRAEADQDQAFVEELCARYEIPCYSKKVDVRKLAAERQNGLEEAGRFARYSFFEELRRQFLEKPDSRNSQVLIALAHHQDDLAESVIMNIGRGSGIAGISTLKPKDRCYRRPLLSLSKAEILELAAAQNWRWVEDRSNQESDFLRNRVRNRLIPVWNEILGYDVRPLLARLAANLEQDEHALFWMRQKVYSECKTPAGELSLKMLQKLPPSMLKAVLDYYIEEAGFPEHSLTQAQLAQIAQVIHGRHGNKVINLAGNLSFKREKNRFFILPDLI